MARGCRRCSSVAKMASQRSRSQRTRTAKKTSFFGNVNELNSRARWPRQANVPSVLSYLGLLHQSRQAVALLVPQLRQRANVCVSKPTAVCLTLIRSSG